MLPRFVEKTNEVSALFPFKRLTGCVGGDFNAAEMRQQANLIRKDILRLKDRLQIYVDKKNLKAVRKLEHYENGLDEELRKCDQMCEMATFINSRYPG